MRKTAASLRVRQTATQWQNKLRMSLFSSFSSSSFFPILQALAKGAQGAAVPTEGLPEADWGGVAALAAAGGGWRPFKYAVVELWPKIGKQKGTMVATLIITKCLLRKWSRVNKYKPLVQKHWPPETPLPP